MSECDVVTLSDSDDDDDIQMICEVAPKQERISASSLATVHIQGGQPLNFGDILPRSILETSQQANQLSTSNQRIIKNRFQRPPPPLPIHNRANVSHQQQIRPQQPRPIQARPSLISLYQFEAYEGHQPMRKSKRCEAKKSKMGKFVCTYDKYSCHKVIQGSVQFVNHMWQHVLKDVKRKSEEFRKIKTRNETDLVLHNTAPPKKEDPENDLFLKQLSTCQFCYATFSTVYLKQQHISACHVNAHKPNSTACNICEQDLFTKPQLEAHLQKNHIVNDAPYSCRQCSYRTSIRLYLFDHYAEKHTDDCLMCPFCIRQIPFRSNQKDREICFVEDFVAHVKSHTHEHQYRCESCALSFADVSNLNRHRNVDHVPLGHNYVITQKPLTKPAERPKISKETEIKNLETKFLKTVEGRRVEDEVACSSMIERYGYDTSTFGPKIYTCTCGEFQTYNGNRAASHWHRCRERIEILEKESRGEKNVEIDETHELDIFKVYPPRSIAETLRKEKRAEKRKQLRIAEEKKRENEILGERMRLPPIFDYALLKLKFPEEELNILVDDVFDNFEKSRS